MSAQHQRTYRARHPERFAASTRQWNAKNVEKVKACKQRWKRDNREKCRAHLAVGRAIRAGRSHE